MKDEIQRIILNRNLYILIAMLEKLIDMYHFLKDRSKFDPSNYFVYVTEACLAITLVLVLLEPVEKTPLFWIITLAAFSLIEVFMFYHAGELGKKN